MQSVGDLIDLNKLREAKQSEADDEVLQAATADVINWLFSELRASFTAFKQAWPTQIEYKAAKKIWLKAFMLANINRKEQLQLGLNHCYLMEKPFVPSPGEFIAWCIPSNDALGVPGLEKAYLEACKNSHPTADRVWSHKLVQHAWKATGSYILSNSASSASFPVFQRNYEISIREWRAGKVIEEIEIPKAITQQPDEKSSKEVAKKAISDCLNMLKGIKPKITSEIADNNEILPTKSFDGCIIL